jgi:hypothetical protein
MPKWNPASVHGNEFSQFPVDQTHYRAKSLLPLDSKPYQEKPFLRTKTKGWQFNHTIGSII